MWNVAGPFEVGNHADLEVVSEAAQNQNHRCLHLAEEDSGVQIAATVAVSVVAEGEAGRVDGEEGSAEAEAASVADVTTLRAVDVVVGTVVADSGVYWVP